MKSANSSDECSLGFVHLSKVSSSRTSNSTQLSWGSFLVAWNLCLHVSSLMFISFKMAVFTSLWQCISSLLMLAKAACAFPVRYRETFQKHLSFFLGLCIPNSTIFFFPLPSLFTDSSLLLSHSFTLFLIKPPLFLLLSLFLGERSEFIICKNCSCYLAASSSRLHLSSSNLSRSSRPHRSASSLCFLSSLHCPSFSIIIWRILSMFCSFSSTAVSWSPAVPSKTFPLHISMFTFWQKLFLVPHRFVSQCLILDEIHPTPGTKCERLKVLQGLKLKQNKRQSLH